MEMMRRFGVPDLVPPQAQQPSDTSMVSSLGVGRLGLDTATGRNNGSAIELSSDSDSAERHYSPEIVSYSTITSSRPLEMEIDDSEDERRQRA